jgi:hypothetical protein
MRIYRGVQVYQPRHYMEVSGNLHAPAALSPEKEQAVLTGQGLGGFQTGLHAVAERKKEQL